MFDRDSEAEMYADASKREKELKYTITKQTANDIANLFIHLMNNDSDFVNFKEPYRTDRKDRVLTWLGIKNEDINPNQNIEEIRKRLISDYSLFGKISTIFCSCCLSGGDDISMFQKFIYQDEYENIVKYQKYFFH